MTLHDANVEAEGGLRWVLVVAWRLHMAVLWLHTVVMHRLEKKRGQEYDEDLVRLDVQHHSVLHPVALVGPELVRRQRVSPIVIRARQAIQVSVEDRCLRECGEAERPRLYSGPCPVCSWWPLC